MNIENFPNRPLVLKSMDKVLADLIVEYLKGTKKIPYLEESFPRSFYITQRLVQLFQNAGKIYIPVYVAILLVRLKRGGNVHAQVDKTFKELINSSLFTSCYAMSLPAAYCYIAHYSKSPASLPVGLFVSFIFTFAIFLETPSRWSETTLFMSSQWLEGFCKFLTKTKQVPSHPYLHVIVSNPESSVWARDGHGFLRVLHREIQKNR